MNDTDSVEIDVNTDNLDEFEALFSGKATAKTEVAEDEKVEDPAPVEDEPEAEAEDTPEEDVDDPDETDDTDDEPEPVKPPKKNRKSFQERIDELTTERYLANRRAEEALKRLEMLEQQLTEAGKAPPKDDTPVVSAAPDPDAKDAKGEFLYPMGEFDPKYIEALSRHTFEQQLAEFKAETAKETRERELRAQAEQQEDQWKQKVSEVAADYDDFRPVVASLEAEFRDLDPDFGVQLAQTIMSMDTGPHVLYYLGNNPEEARKIVAAGPMGSILALGRLEARIQSALSKPTKEAAPRVTQAPEPAPTVSRGRGSSGGVRDDTDDLDAFEKKFFKK